MMRALATALALAVGVPASAAAQTAGRILVVPFENASRDSRIVWLGEASAVLLADNLNALGAQAITREERREAFERLQIPPVAALTDATVIRVGQLVGASAVVVGSLQLEGDTLAVRARAIALEAGRVQADTTERGAIPDLFGIFARIAQRIAAPSPRGAPAGALTNPSVAAFENYIKGLLAETPSTALSYLNAALQAQPTFDRARLALWDVYDEQGDHERAMASVAAVPSTSDLYRRARFRVGLSQVQLRRDADAFTTFNALADERSTPAVLNNLGVIQLRRGATSQSGSATYYFTKAAEADPTEPDYCFNIGYAYWAARDVQAVIYWLRETVRRSPSDGDAHYILGAALTAAGNTAEANREKELARRLSSTYAEWEKRPATDAVPKGLERIKSDVELPRVNRVEETLATSGQRDQQELARFYLDRGRRLYEQENDRDALTELNRSLFLSPYLADAHLLVGRIHLRGGRFRDAIDALKISVWSADTAEAHAVLAQAYVDARDLDAARAEAQRALTLDPASAEAKHVLEQLSP
jgi:tetratricopeptide (TPR) repeat protein